MHDTLANASLLVGVIFLNKTCETLTRHRITRLFCLCRSPDTSRIRSKMVYASTKDRFKRELDGIQVELQATDPSEMSFDIIKSRAL
jgi:hypothetical protein